MPLSPSSPLPPDAEIAAAKRAARQAMKTRLRALDFDRCAVAAAIFRNLERLPDFADARTLAVYLDFGFEAPIRPFLPRLFERDALDRLDEKNKNREPNGGEENAPQNACASRGKRARRPRRVVAAPRCVGRELEFYTLTPPSFVDATAAPRENADDFLDRDAFAPERVFRLSDLESGVFGIWEPRPDASRLVPPDAFDLVLVPGLAFDLDGGRLGRGAGFYDRFLAALQPKTRLVGVALDEQLVEKTPRDRFDLPVDALATPSRLVVFR